MVCNMECVVQLILLIKLHIYCKIWAHFIDIMNRNNVNEICTVKQEGERKQTKKKENTPTHPGTLNVHGIMELCTANHAKYSIQYRTNITSFEVQ